MSKHFTKGSSIPEFPQDGKLILYSMRFCPFAQRAHLVLDAKEIPYHVCFINLNHKPEWLIEKSPLGKVPALELRNIPGDPLIESLVICDYLDEKYPQNPLNSKDPLQRAKDRILLERFNAFIGSFYFQVMFNHNLGAGGVKGAIVEMNKALDVLEEELKRRGTKFYGGEKPGFVDYMIWPWCERTDVLPFVLGDDNGLDKVRYENLIEWKNEMKQVEAVKRWIVSAENHFKYRNSFLKTLGTSDSPDYDMILP